MLGPKISDADFCAYFDAARAGKVLISDEGLEEARRYRYVFVGGFHNERLPGYLRRTQGSCGRREFRRTRSISFFQAPTTQLPEMHGPCANSSRRLPTWGPRSWW